MKNTKKLLQVCVVLLSAVLLLALLGGCVASTPDIGAADAQDQLTDGETPTDAAEPTDGAEPSDSAEEMDSLADGVLSVGMEIGYPPFELYDGDTPVGFDVDLATKLSEILGVTVDIKDTAWDGIFDGLDIDKYDCVISAVTISSKRRESMDFSDHYIENWQSIVVKKGSEPITSMLGLNGVKVGYQGETTSDEYLHAMIDTGDITCETAAYDKVLNCFDDLRLGRLGAVICDSTVADGYISREPDEFEISWLQSSEDGAEAELFGVAVKKGNQKLVDDLNGALKQLKDDGTIEALMRKWF